MLTRADIESVSWLTLRNYYDGTQNGTVLIHSRGHDGTCNYSGYEIIYDFSSLENSLNSLECPMEHSIFISQNTAEQMKVNKKLAAKMVGRGRTTFYRDIEKKGISIDADGNIDVSELIRVYGNQNVKTPDQLKQSLGTAKEQDGAHQNTQLLEEIKRLKSDLENISIERKREREQAAEQIDHLKIALDKSMSQNDGLTRLLTDERTKEERLSHEKEDKQANTLKEVLETVQAMQAENQKRGWWPFRRKSA